VVVASLVFLCRGWQGRDYLALAGIVFLLGVQTFMAGLSWSPYYQIMVSEVDGRSHIAVNGIPHQTILPVSYLTATHYNVPYTFTINSAPGRVLVVGAGSGNDVALALAHGARHIDAVEIDPTIQQIGENLHPDRPYADPRVDVVIDDGRAFMQRSPGSYDLIIFALPDSLTLLSGQSSLRLESYLFTVEAMEQASSLLAPDGAFVMYNFYREDWLIARLSATIAQAFGQTPCVVSIGNFDRLALLAIGANSTDACPGSIGSSVDGPPPSVDDHPFLYVRDRRIPSFYAVTLGLIALASLITVRVGVGSFSRLKPYGDLFALGTAFLLLETKSVVQFALWFGTTWLVNALVFAGILAAVLSAVAVAKKVSLPRANVLYGLLFVSLAIAWVIPPAALLEITGPLRLLTATLLTFTPVFLANLIFAQRSAQTASATAAFGANLLGALFGGILEYAALIVGYRALIVLAGIAYFAALVLRPKNVANTAN
jgi:hypothetical protein